MKDYKIYRCPYCSCEYYDRTAKDGRKVGDPMLQCPECKKKSYRSSILEPALISGNRYFGIRFASLYGNIRIGLILLYAVFLFIILVKKEFLLGVCLVGIAVVLYTIYELVRIYHRNSFLKSDLYNSEISRSLARLADVEYAAMIIKNQGIDETSVYYFELHNTKERE